MSETLLDHYRQLQRYVGWSDDDARCLAEAYPIIEPEIPALIDDFYEEIDRHETTRNALTGGAEQVQVLKAKLNEWLQELFLGPHDEAFVERRRSVGRRHVDIGLPQVFTNAALSRLRSGLLSALKKRWVGDLDDLWRVKLALNRIIDLDLAIIETVYHESFLEQQARVERLAAVGQLGAGIAHELRNPLNAIRTSVYYLLHARNPAAEKVAEHLQRIDRQVARADGVITALTEFARLPLPTLEAVDLEACLDEVLANQTLPENVTVHFQRPSEPAVVQADRHQLPIVFANLIRNARDAMPAGGRLLVGIRDRGDEIAVEIRDTGDGIPAEHLARITEPLFTTKPRGIGLGLAISASIVEKHNGRIDVTSEPNQGSSFIVSLPKRSAR